MTVTDAVIAFIMLLEIFLFIVLPKCRAKIRKWRKRGA